ncbi:gamma-glutamyltransferase [Chachezhania antarctica]|uniref:gamma-glutamyltransferase n=1 Tax=Chachezhania antarctica TaxID=2340860 RepID=UPI000EAD8C7F|nr:gamma-glutamyltransferase [Chachezhania antarctica]|tara:strand:+ start:2452 stop:4254 length:1803 start_codon:yes stop_codon:yes gene_type:complete
MQILHLSRIAALVGFGLAASGAYAQQAADAVAPEAATDQDVPAFEDLSGPITASLAAKAAGEPVQGQEWMVSAANPLAVEAGAGILSRGGTAADALVAVQTVLGLVEPQSSGLGGGAFLLWYDAETGKLTTLDGRETAPSAATPLLFQTEGEPMGFFEAVVGGRSVGVPGTPALLQDVHDRWGKLDWAPLFDPAITLARDGFKVSPRLSGLVVVGKARLRTHPETAEYFLPGGFPLLPGRLLQNPAYADVLETLAAEGAQAFYKGQIARDIVAAVQSVDNPGLLTVEDMAVYRVKERAPVCAAYRVYEVCGMGPPSSGALTVGQILGMLSHFDLAALGPDSAEAWRLIGDASRLAFADRGRYIADSDFVPVPSKGLLDPAYLAERARLLESGTALDTVEPGKPSWDHAGLWGDGASPEQPSTSHISIVDAYGNVASMTTTIENAFGSRVMVRGFLLNNELTDFSFSAVDDGRPVANRVEPGKRPRSSMAPTIVMQDGAPVLAVGSPGGSRIIGYVAQAIIAWADWGMNVQKAVSMPHGVNRFGTFDLEGGTPVADLAGPLGEMGFEVETRLLNSGLHAIQVGDGLEGGADPRREGIALGR